MAQALADVIEHLSELPPFPKVTTRLLAMLDDPSISVNELSEVISTDPSLVLKVIHMANSPFYMVSKPIESVKDAVFILGLNTIKNITTAISIQKGISAFTPRNDLFDMTSFWKHCYATAIAANKLAVQLKIKNPEKFYLVGLIHDIGKLVIAYYWPESWNTITRYMENSGESYLASEKKIFGYTHNEISAQLFRKWNFPEEIIALVENQYLDSTDPEQEQLLFIIKAAEQTANRCELGFPKSDVFENMLIEDEMYEKISRDLSSEVNYQLSVLT